MFLLMPSKEKLSANLFRKIPSYKIVIPLCELKITYFLKKYQFFKKYQYLTFLNFLVVWLFLLLLSVFLY